MNDERKTPVCPHCNLYTALVAIQTRKCTNCGKNVDEVPSWAQSSSPVRSANASSSSMSRMNAGTARRGSQTHSSPLYVN